MVLIQGRRWVLTIKIVREFLDLYHYGDNYNSHTGFSIFWINLNFEYVHWKQKGE